MINAFFKLTYVKYLVPNLTSVIKRGFQSCSNKWKESVLNSSMTNVLNVAEKNDAAKNLSEILSNGHYNRRDGFSRYNKIYEFDYQIGKEKCNMIMTSVSGHLLNIEFTGQFKNWKSCNPVALFEAPIINVCPDDYKDIKRTLEREAKKCKKLIIWTDGDREGENIGFEIIGVCLNINPRLEVLRARFSEITRPAISRAINNLQIPDKNTSDAVEVRKELDLRIGAAFTRFQTIRLQRLFPQVLSNNVISYGSCQFPTMGFVVERYKQVKNFKPQTFWKIEVNHEKENINTNFLWKRVRIFDKCATVAFCIPCWNDPRATVLSVKNKNKSKWRPLPLDTVELEKNGSRKLRINAKETMRIAESLYTRGFISYPRTETNTFPKEMDLAGLVQMQTVDPNWGDFARRVIEIGPNPRQGTKTDNAHPPIHPTKYTATLGGDEKKIYDFIVRHFLACVSQDAKGMETAIEIRIATELFSAKGLLILERNYLEVYPYEKWSDKEVPEYKEGEVFEPDSIDIEEGSTTAPSLLTEADLISLMEKHGIGTDATHAEHIEKIKSRIYVGLNNEEKFVPSELGIGLADGYDSMGVEMSKPNYRAELESDLKCICEGTKNPDDVLKQQIQKYKDIFIQAVRDAAKIDAELSKYFGAAVANNEANIVEEPLDQPVMKCPKCRTSDIFLKQKKDKKGYFLSCMGFPACQTSIWFPDSIETAKVSEEICQQCRNGPVHKISFTHRMYNILEEHTACFGGCDRSWFDELDIRPFQLAGPAANDNAGNIVGSLREINVGGGGNQQGLNNDRGEARGGGSRLSTKKTTTKRKTSTTNEGGGLQNWLTKKGPNTTLNNDEPQTPNCICGTPAIRLTVKKDGPNQGRNFYKCSQTTGQCNFFQFEEEINERNDSIRLPNQNSTNSTNSTSEVIEKCLCGETCKLKTVLKESANKGRKFFSCPKPQGQSCNFFKWADVT